MYAWEPDLSFGRHEPAGRRYDADRVAALGLATVRRPTGGRAVWHAGELTYAVAAPADELGALRQAYRDIHLVLRDAVRSLGVPAELAPLSRAASVDTGACFASPAGGEVLVAGGKVVGSAQLRRGAALLQHGASCSRMTRPWSRGDPRPGAGGPDRCPSAGRPADGVVGGGRRRRRVRRGSGVGHRVACAGGARARASSAPPGIE